MRYDNNSLVRSTLGSELSSSEKLVLISLASHRSGGDGKCYPSHSTLARETGMSRRNVYRVLGLLKDKGIVNWKYTKSSNQYFIKDSKVVRERVKSEKSENPKSRIVARFPDGSYVREIYGEPYKMPPPASEEEMKGLFWDAIKPGDEGSVEDYSVDELLKEIAKENGYVDEKTISLSRDALLGMVKFKDEYDSAEFMKVTEGSCVGP